jgi:hypothetical protein
LRCIVSDLPEHLLVGDSPPSGPPSCTPGAVEDDDVDFIAGEGWLAASAICCGSVVRDVGASRTTDTPFSRLVAPPSTGRVVATAQVGGVHHRNDRATA